MTVSWKPSFADNCPKTSRTQSRSIRKRPRLRLNITKKTLTEASTLWVFGPGVVIPISQRSSRSGLLCMHGLAMSPERTITGLVSAQLATYVFFKLRTCLLSRSLARNTLSIRNIRSALASSIPSFSPTYLATSVISTTRKHSKRVNKWIIDRITRIYIDKTVFK